VSCWPRRKAENITDAIYSTTSFKQHGDESTTIAGPATQKNFFSENIFLVIQVLFFLLLQHVSNMSGKLSVEVFSAVTVAFLRREPRMQGTESFGRTNNKNFPARPGSVFIACAALRVLNDRRWLPDGAVWRSATPAYRRELKALGLLWACEKSACHTLLALALHHFIRNLKMCKILNRFPSKTICWLIGFRHCCGDTSLSCADCQQHISI